MVLVLLRDIGAMIQSTGLAFKSQTLSSDRPLKKSVSVSLPPSSMVSSVWLTLQSQFQTSLQSFNKDGVKTYGRTTPSPFTLQTLLAQLEALLFWEVLTHNLPTEPSNITQSNCKHGGFWMLTKFQLMDKISLWTQQLLTQVPVSSLVLLKL